LRIIGYTKIYFTVEVVREQIGKEFFSQKKPEIALPAGCHVGQRGGGFRRSRRFSFARSGG
jgi:hypothetical protein